MKLKNRILIFNTMTIFICLLMLFMVVGIVMNVFKTKYVDRLTVEDFEKVYPNQKFEGMSKNPEKPSLTPEQAMKYTNQTVSNFYLRMEISIAIAILAILLISQFFTNKIVQRIMIPINKLIEANKKVEDGNYDEEIKYNGEYEFELLCNSFNKMQKSIKNEKELNKREQKSKEDMITGISHDLRTPLTSIKGYVKGIKDGVASTKEKQEQYLDVAYSNACEMDVLIEKLFNLSQLEASEISYNFNEEKIGDLINLYLETQKVELADKGIALKKSIKANCFVNVDKEQLFRVFSNVIYNSIKYANTKNLSIIFNVKEEVNNILIEIKDNGKGIKEEKLDRIFEQFYRCDESRTNSSKEGNGLGLYICKRIIAKHNGNINAKNDNGLKIIISLPKLERPTIKSQAFF
ncbi:MAG: HAMP domain-containing sensor histidine kinase [Clostridia bacterium]|nr:HAMP domain-containing sensor histidine kinase [Clostridia bacterium]